MGESLKVSCHQKDAEYFLNFYVEYENGDYNPNLGTNCLFQYNFLYILCEQCLS